MKRCGCGLPFAVAAAALLNSAPAAAQAHPGFDCNLFGPTHPCDPYLLYPPRQHLQLTMDAREAEGSRRKGRKINTLRELFAELRACLQPPPVEQARPGMELTVRVSFKRDGNILGAPRFTYVNRTASEAQRDLYREAILDGLRRCAPLAFTSGMGGAVAGRPLVIRFIENRNP